jgi:hypothetical protein
MPDALHDKTAVHEVADKDLGDMLHRLAPANYIACCSGAKWPVDDVPLKPTKVNALLGKENRRPTEYRSYDLRLELLASDFHFPLHTKGELMVSILTRDATCFKRPSLITMKCVALSGVPALIFATCDCTSSEFLNALVNASA